MGFFGTYLFEGGRWAAADSSREAVEPWLFLNIYDSDIATVMYRPTGAGTGIAFLGCTPRTYFDDISASSPTDTGMESLGLATWWATQHGSDDAARDAKQQELLTYLADDDEAGADSVEVTAGRFLAALGLPLPALP